MGVYGVVLDAATLTPTTKKGIPGNPVGDSGAESSTPCVDEKRRRCNFGRTHSRRDSTMSKFRVLLDEKLEHHARSLLNDVGIKVDVARLKTVNLIMWLKFGAILGRR